MKRRNFLKKLGIGVVAVPTAIKSLGDQKAKEYHENVPVKTYKGKPEGNVDYSTASQEANIVSGTVGAGDFYPYESFKNRKPDPGDTEGREIIFISKKNYHRRS